MQDVVVGRGNSHQNAVCCVGKGFGNLPPRFERDLLRQDTGEQRFHLKMVIQSQRFAFESEKQRQQAIIVKEFVVHEVLQRILHDFDKIDFRDKGIRQRIGGDNGHD